MFDIVYLKKTGQIVRVGYFDDSLVLDSDEDKLSFDGWVEFEGKAVNVKTKTLVDAKEKNAFSLRGKVGTATDEIKHSFGTRLTEIESWTTVLLRRKELLDGSDYLMMPDYPISDERRANLAAYRQALRDITKQSDPTNILWPEFPEK